MNPDADERMIGHGHLLEYVMGELDETQVREFELHLARCSRCRAELKALLPVHAELMTLYPDVRTHSNPAQVKSTVLQYAFSRRLPKCAGGVADGSPTPMARVEPRAKPRAAVLRLWRFHRAGLVGSVMTVLLIGGTLVWGENAERSVAPAKPIPRVAQTGTGASLGAGSGSSRWSTSGGQASAAWKTGADRPAMMLHPTSAFFGARGQVRLVPAKSARRLLVQVSEVPMQSHLGCYEVWQVYNGRSRSLGEFLVNSNGAGQIAIPLPAGGLRGKIVVTLEPRWGDSSPQGPAVLKGQIVSS